MIFGITGDEDCGKGWSGEGGGEGGEGNAFVLDEGVFVCPALVRAVGGVDEGVEGVEICGVGGSEVNF